MKITKLGVVCDTGLIRTKPPLQSLYAAVMLGRDAADLLEYSSCVTVGFSTIDFFWTHFPRLIIGVKEGYQVVCTDKSAIYLTVNISYDRLLA